MRIPGVVGVGDGGGHIITYLEHRSPYLLSALPTEVSGVRFQLQACGPIGLLQARTDRWRPIVGGISVAHPSSTSGTYGSAVIDRRVNDLAILSANHVLALDWGELRVGRQGDSTLQPGPYYSGQDPQDKVGELSGWQRAELQPTENLIDGAVSLITLPEGTRQEILGLGLTRLYPIEPSVGMVGLGSGCSSGVKASTVQAVNATVDVEAWGTCRFTDQVIVSPAYLPGDSGMVYVDGATGRPVGMAYAGNKQITVLCKASHLETLLGIEFIASTDPWAVTWPPSILAIQLPLLFSQMLWLWATR